jgi:hypothetical protein
MLLLISAARAQPQGNHEVWAIDQSNSFGTIGGRIYIYEGAAIGGQSAHKAVPEVVDLAGGTTALCLANTGANPVRPHMLFFNGTHSHAVLAFVTSGHVVIYNAKTRVPVACFRMSAGADGARQAHAAIPAPDDSYILVSNQNGKLVERIDTNYRTNTFVHNTAATLDLVNGTTPNAVPRQLAGVRPDNAPITAIPHPDSTLGFVTLRGGGLFVVTPKTNPIAIVGEYDLHAVHPNGFGGAAAGGSMFINSGGGTPANLAEFDVYRFPLAGYSSANAPNIPAPVVVFSDDVNDRDSHGIMATKHDTYLWVIDRHGNMIEVFDRVSGGHVNTIHLASGHSSDPSPDLMDIAPAGNRIYLALRGPNPLSGDPHASTGSSPGVGVVRVEQNGRHGVLEAIVPISNRDALGVERADIHTVRVRRN